MIICWDNLEKLKYDKTKNWWISDKYNKYIYVDSCPGCGNPFLTITGSLYNPKAYCSNSCAVSGKRAPAYIDGREKNIEWRRKRSRIYYWKNRKRCLERGKKYKEAHRNELREYSHRYHQKNKNARLEYAEKYYTANKEKRDAYNERYWGKNKDVLKEKRLKWLEANKHVMRFHRAKRRATIKGQTAETANEDAIRFIYDVCSEVNELLEDRIFHVDHIIPLTKGGLHHEKNLQILEGILNTKKGNKITNQFIGLSFAELSK